MKLLARSSNRLHASFKFAGISWSISTSTNMARYDYGRAVTAHVSMPGKIGPYTAREWRIAALSFAAYLAASVAVRYFFPASVSNPADAILLATVFFGGIRLAPIVFVAASAVELVSGNTGLTLLASTLTTSLGATAGGYTLSRWQVDPIFRRDSDAFRLIVTLSGIALFSPLIFSLLFIAQGMAFTLADVLVMYAADLFSLLLFAPFALRWSAKFRFSRTWRETAEIVVIFILLLMVDAMYFIQRLDSLFGIPLMYLLLIPLLFISLRLRPRFVTTAFFITGVFALLGFAGATPLEIFQKQLFLIVTAMIFYIITALEEHRRSTANQMQSQVVTLRNVVARVSSESRAKNDFIAILAHELRNPLTPVVSGIELLKLKHHTPEDREVLRSMEDGMQTARSLLNDLLDVSRISEGKITLNKRIIDLEPVLDNAISATEHHRRERHQNIVFKSSVQRLKILGDAVRIEQIFSNLLTNASKYSDEGDKITLLAREDGEFVEVQVIDEGVGLAPEALKTVFEPFQQIDQGARSQDGLGIGLSLVLDFVKMHDGTVWAESDGPGRGSRFIVRLPLVGKT